MNSRTLPAIALVFAAALTASAQDWAKPRLENSPRHGEWITMPSAGRELKCFIVYPEIKTKAVSVVVIHEIFGLTDWVRGVCDQLADAGYIAIAPDFLSGDTYEEARQAISRLDPARVTADLNATVDYVKSLPAANGTVTVAGFCWGGSQAFRYATQNANLAAAFVFYGSAPEDTAALGKIACPVHGFYGENDARINATLAATETAMKNAGKTFDPVIYAGAGHGFMRAGEAPDASDANKQAREDAWKRWKELLAKLK
jgi:carboxymethylenebutenolidase